MNCKEHKDTATTLVEGDFPFLIKYAKPALRTLNVLSLLFIVWVMYWGVVNDIFTSEIALMQFLEKTGLAAPIVFIMIQIIQTIVPFIPGGLTIPMGALIFGMSYGFFLSFIGIMIGSVINFMLARIYGRPLVELITSKQKTEKYTRWLQDEKRFERLFTFGMFFPLSPADFLCYLAGLSKLTFKKYMLILSLGKPFTLFLYTLGTTEILRVIFHFFS